MSGHDTTNKLKAALWQLYGNPASPSEWDGRVCGGGKLSQCFGEYHKAIDLLELTPDAVVLDIGGGSNRAGFGFFTNIIAPFVKEVHISDPLHPKANHNLGVLCMQRGQLELALSYLDATLNADPAQGQYWLSYIDSLRRTGQIESAREVLAFARQQGLEGDGVDALDELLQKM